MSTIKEAKRRLSRTLGSILCVGFGVYTGRIIGQFVARIVFYSLQGHSGYRVFLRFVSIVSGTRSEELMAQNLSLAMSNFEAFFSILGMFFFGAEMFRVHYWYFYLRGIKTHHAWTYDGFRKYFFHVDNAYVDMLWAFLYVLSLDAVPSVLCFIAGNIVYAYSSPLWGIRALFPAFFTAYLVFMWTTEQVKNLLHPHRIEWELKDSSLIKGVIGGREQESLLGRREEEDDEE